MADDKKKYLKVLEELSPETLDNSASYSDEEVKQHLAEAAMLISSYRKARKADQDLAALKEQVKNADEMYSQGIKLNNAKVELYKDELVSRGKYDDNIGV